MLLSQSLSAALVITTVGVSMAIAPQAQAAVFNGGGGLIEGVGIGFPGSSGVFTSQIVIGPGSNLVNNLTVTLFGLAHPDASALQAKLTHVDTGTSVVLFPNLDLSTELDGNYSFNDGFTGNLSTFAGVFTPSGAYLPDGSLAAFNGELQEGTWELEIQNTSELFSGSLDGWQLGFNLLQFGIEGTLSPAASIPEYANAFIEGSVFFDADTVDLDPDPTKGLYEISNFFFSVTSNGETQPFAFFIPDQELATSAFLEVSSRRYRISPARVSNDNSVCDPFTVNIDLFFDTEDPNPNILPLNPPPIETFVPEQSSITLFGEGCGDEFEQGVTIPVAEITKSEEIPFEPPTEEPPQSVPEPGFVAGLGVLGLGWLLKRKK